jgi:beta-phosphoglucomutase
MLPDFLLVIALDMKKTEKKAGPLPTMAAIFDMDGVISDNMAYHTKAWEFFLQKYAPRFKIGDVTPHFGKTNLDLMSYIFGRSLSRADVERYGEEKEELYRRFYADHMAPLPGLTAFLEELRAARLRTVVATSAPKSNVAFLLDGLNIRDSFDAVVDASEVTRGKPDPEIYFKAAQRVGCTPPACIVFEDSLTGIQAGRNAGMKVIAVATTLPPERLTGTDLIIKDFTEIRVGLVLELLKNVR